MAILVLSPLLSAGAILAEAAPAAAAQTGGYPYWNMPCELSPYNTPGYCNTVSGPYDWGPVKNGSAASQISPYGYGYRNCTDFVAWTVASIGVKPAQYKGLGNAKSWGVNAASHGLVDNSTPAVGSAAVSTAGSFGHVAFVTNVSGSQITVSQYNQAGTGAYSAQTSTAASLGFSSFVHFEKYESGGAQGSGAPSITSVTPDQGEVGTGVTISGSGLANASSVTFNGVTAAISSDTASTITTSVPGGVTGGAGSIIVTTPDGTATYGFSVDASGTNGAVESLRGDFTGIGRSDLLVATPRGSTGINYQVALSNGKSFGPWQLWANTGSSYTIDKSRLLVGDFTGKAKDDIAIVTPRGATGLNIQVAVSNGKSFGPWQLWANTGSNYTIDQSQVVAGDFTGNGTDDIALVTPRGATGLNYQVALSNGASFGSWQLWANTGSNYTIDESQLFGGAFTRDGKDDIGIVTPRGATGLNYQVALSKGSSFGSWQLWANTGTNYSVNDEQVVG